jgi:hypothetical protein
MDVQPIFGWKSLPEAEFSKDVVIDADRFGLADHSSGIIQRKLRNTARHKYGAAYRSQLLALGL